MKVDVSATGHTNTQDTLREHSCDSRRNFFINLIRLVLSGGVHRAVLQIN